MKVRFLVAALAALAVSGIASAQTYVQGHTRSDGTYVQGHYRSAPNSTKLDNYSTQGNRNPYTNERGTVNPYRPSSSNPTGSPYNQSRRRSSYP